MSQELERKRKGIDIDCGRQLPGAVGLRTRWEDLISLPVYRSFADHGLRLREFDPVGLTEADKEFMLEMRHDFYAHDLLSRATLAPFLPGNAIVFGSYGGLVAILTARLMVDCPTPFDEADRRRLYSLLDRLFFGVEAFDQLDEVPTVTADDYRTMKKVKKPGDVQTLLSVFTSIHRIILKEQVGQGYDQWCTVENAALDMLLVASAKRHGRTAASFTDAANAVEAFIALFHTDVVNLPLVRRIALQVEG